MSNDSSSHEMDDGIAVDSVKDPAVAAVEGGTASYSELNPDDAWGAKAKLAGKALGHANNAYNVGAEIAEGDSSAHVA